MRWNTQPNRSAAIAVMVVVLSGCHQWPDVYVDDLPPSSMVTTASMDRARAIAQPETLRVRDYEPFIVEAHDGTVVHAPLWMEDPYEMVGSDDGMFARTGGDFLYFVYGALRTGANLGLMPLSMLVDPPWAMVCSDGIARRSRRSWLPQPYDPQRCSGVAVPLDIEQTWRAAVEDSPDHDEPLTDAEDDTR